MVPAGYLLDTHALVWWWLGDPALSGRARSRLQAGGIFFVSAVSGFEIALKVRAGKLPAMAEPLALFDESIRDDGFIHLPVGHGHAIRAGLLDGTHKDPFDRMIAAQALLDNLTVIPRDKPFAEFGCAVLW